ncbi:MAG TPA: hypothetical protein DEA44_09725 [Firmicutes bacterium]|nr:hypothetical protein [Bacillota bacterium]
MPIPSDADIVEMTKALTQARIANWLTGTLFTWRWWFVLALLIVPWIGFYYAADRKKLPRLFLHGTILFILILTFDVLGYENGIWAYPCKILPFGPLIAFIDAGPLPIIYMLEYQYFCKWKDFIAVSVITSLLFSFLLEPIVQAMGLYTLISWKYIYSFPIYVVLPLLSRWAVDRIFAAAEQ